MCVFSALPVGLVLLHKISMRAIDFPASLSVTSLPTEEPKIQAQSHSLAAGRVDSETQL